MELTQEQLNIITSSGDIKINAVAGSGKTTTIIEYAKTRPAHSRILYLAFNKSVKLDAARKFKACGLSNVKVETAHSLAYKKIIFRDGYTVNPHGYKTHEIADLLEIAGRGEKHGKYIIANHINKFISYFCNSNEPNIYSLDYLDVVTDSKARAFVKTCYEYIQNQAADFIQKMEDGVIPVTHDFYLKKFQLEHPRLPYDYILFDEGQDASAAMLDVFLRQRATKVIVGDTHQQIYGWRYAVNSLEKTDFRQFHLSTSFRFGQDIAALAEEVLKYKTHFTAYEPIAITGKGKEEKVKTIAVIARTNLGLLLRAIEYIIDRDDIKHVYFEGNLNSYAYADDGTSLYDVLNLFNKKHHLIRDSLVKQMTDIADLEEYIEHTEDIQLATMLEIVKEHGNDIPGIIRKIKSKHVANEEKDKAQVIFSTVHRCKGMEYDHIILVDDFITEERLKKNIKEHGEKVNTQKLNEEVNLLYVAVTRTRNIIQIPDLMIPATCKTSPNITIVATDDEELKEKSPLQLGIKK
ncbi:UvrD-helicase domain-containing protein [Chitinophaga arvensicola]|uniref:DNA 3'-5' helicase n=1 Tax=Chitinophaga arvensicola TaxID=29529 RepID=A0A1I0SD70_9BACT|nr:UvrD-helicase domain-containing protein [Chitinophaga arvensicola]SEW55858.1 Superfamily I DNA or RNA helicase [Chitinophaga arvensicola]